MTDHKICSDCVYSYLGQFGMFCTNNEANQAINPVSGDAISIEGREVNGGNSICLDLRVEWFGRCGPIGNLFKSKHNIMEST